MTADNGALAVPQALPTAPDRPNVVVPPSGPTQEQWQARRDELDAEQARLAQAAKDDDRRARRADTVRSTLSDVVLLAGVAVVALGLYQLAAWLGIVVAGLGLIVVGVAIDPPQWRRADKAPAPAPTAADA